MPRRGRASKDEDVSGVGESQTLRLNKSGAALRRAVSAFLDGDSSEDDLRTALAAHDAVLAEVVKEQTQHYSIVFGPPREPDVRLVFIPVGKGGRR